MAQGILVNSEVSVTTANGGTRPRTTSSAYSLVPPSVKNQQASLHHRPRSKSTGYAFVPGNLEFRDDTLIDERNRRLRRDGLAELIHFLRNHEPPPDNFMSIPDGVDGEDRGRWSKIKHLGRRSKSLSKYPAHIRLPDSAISGTTIGGHRHIAISIPLNASPFGRNPRTQYPVFHNPGGKPATPRYAPTRAIVNEKGVVTVLRTVTEDHESSSPSPVSQRARGASLGSSPWSAYSPHSPAASFSLSPRGKASDAFAISPGLHHKTDQFQRVSNACRELQFSQDEFTRLHRRDGMPLRASSLTANRFTHPGNSSIDAMMFQRQHMGEWPMPPSHSRTVSKDESQRHSLSKSIITSSDNDPVVAHATTGQAPSRLVASPVLVSGDVQHTAATKGQRRSPLSVAHRPESPTPSARSLSRKERVRDRKRRDMEALRAASQKRSLQAADDAQSSGRVRQRPKRQHIFLDMDMDTDMDDVSPPPLPDKSPHRHTLGPIRVVADVKPSPPRGSQGFESNKHKAKRDSKIEPRKRSQPNSQSNSQPGSKSQSPENQAAPVPTLHRKGPSNPTPPLSTHGSPAQKQGPMDRASLSRRREWNATREEERKAREAARTKARNSVMAKDEVDGSTSPTMDKEAIRRYEVYREYRIREMERRVRRLERNGDVWLRALVPILDNLNRTLASVNGIQLQERAQGWVSDDEYAGPVNISKGRPSTGLSREGSRGRMMRRSGTSEREFLDNLARSREALEAAGHTSDDLNGFDTIEPLMRELAGRSRLSFDTRSFGLAVAHSEDDEAYLQGF